jgi:hypothetical protein
MDEIFGVDLDRVVNHAVMRYAVWPLATVDEVYDCLEIVASDISECDEAYGDDWPDMREVYRIVDMLNGELSDEPIFYLMSYEEQKAWYMDMHWAELNAETEDWLESRNTPHNHGDTNFHKEIGKYRSESRNSPDKDDDGSGYNRVFPDRRIGHASDIKLSDRRDQRRKAHASGELRTSRRAARQIVRDNLKSGQFDRISNCIPVRFL